MSGAILTHLVDENQIEGISRCGGCGGAEEAVAAAAAAALQLAGCLPTSGRCACRGPGPSFE